MAPVLSVEAVSLGMTHSCALLSAGNVRCWGDATFGKLGYGDTNNVGDDETPASAGDVDVGGAVVQITSGQAHTCALLTGGKVRCWGYGEWGQLGYGNKDNVGADATPASAGDVDVGGAVIQIGAGGDYTCALLAAGTVRCWGYGATGALGYGNSETIGDDETPASAGDVDVGGTVVQIAVGYAHTCALLATGAVRCWGTGEYGELGYASTNDVGNAASQTPASAGDVDVGGKTAQVASGGVHTCVRLDTGAVRCWGGDFSGDLGYGNTTDAAIGDDETPASAGDVPVF
jgi:alpha-tubulin suppressor-like RCC1 family protein